MKVLKYFMFILLGIFFLNSNVSAVNWQGGPESILNAVERDARPGRDTRLDGVNGAGVYETLDSIKYYSVPYLRWLVYIGLGLAVIFVIYNGLLMTLTPLSNEGYAKVKKGIGYLALGIIGLTGFSLIIKIVLSIVSNITG